MKREFRLKRPSEFKKTFKEGRRFLSHRFVLYVCKNSLPHARLGVSISKSHFKLATRRNRLRRIAKELFRKDAEQSFKGYDFVVASRGGASGSRFTEAVSDLKSLISRLKK